MEFNAHQATSVDALEPVWIGEGCTRRTVPAPPGVNLWVVDMAPGSRWPHTDLHDTGKAFYVISGEVIEGDARYRAGTCVTFAPDSRHRPRTETGVRLFGLNLTEAAFVGAGGQASALAHSFHPTQG